MKVVHLPTDIGHRAYSLCRAERDLGLDSWMVIKEKSLHESSAVQPLYSKNHILYIGRLLAASYKSFHADVLMANCGQSLIELKRFNKHLLDIPVYDFLNKRIIVTYQGCDIRLCETCPVRNILPVNVHCCNAKGYTYKQLDQLKLNRHKIWLRYADALLGITPDLCAIPGIQYSPHAKYLDHNTSYAIKNNLNSKVRIGHMARRHIQGERIHAIEYLKGTPWIEEQIRAVIARNPREIEYVPIEGVSWQQSLKIITSCDIIVDQVVSGWYGGISVEAALLGTLPIAYIDQRLIKYLPIEMQQCLPVVALKDKGELEYVLSALMQNREKILEESLRCRANALLFHDARVVAKKIIEEYYT